MSSASVAQFAYFVVRDLFLERKSDEVQRAFDLMAYWLRDGSASLRELIVIGFLEDVQNLLFGQGLALDSFVPFLGPKSREGWDELERFWAGSVLLEPQLSCSYGAGDRT